MRMETLLGDFQGKLEYVSLIANSGIDVYAHNMETVERLTPRVRDRRAGYRQSLATLEKAKAANPLLVTKSSIMLGLGEEDDEIEQALRDLRTAGVEVVTFGQYLQPTKGHMKVSRYVEPAEFDRWKERATSEFGFAYCASGPMVRSSYRAGEFFIEAMLGKRPRAYEIPENSSNGRESAPDARETAKPVERFIV
jgi:lipoic acid synthetase